ncbi:MAG: [FeFe] hydrogenase H-cluster radical SAM maturase HydE [Vulcanimicrobiota bacterium]
MSKEISDTEERLDRLEVGAAPESSDLEYFLNASDQDIVEMLYSRADSVRKRHIGDGIYLRGLIEFSSFCRNRCFYCGLNRNNTGLSRYRMTSDEILRSVDAVASCRISTVVLQSGEDDSLDHIWMRDLIAEIKNRHNMAVTLSLGEWESQAYAMWKEAGADRYLLKIETTDSGLYDALHPGMSYRNRLRCLRDLRSLGYEVGSGIMVGLKGQTAASLAGDIQFFKEENLDMIGIGPFISHPSTELCREPSGDAAMTLKTVALTRIVTKTTNIPATTAISSLDEDFRSHALKCGANVLMPIFTPVRHKGSYEIYPHRRCIDEEGVHCAGCLERLAESLGRYIDYSRGDRKKATGSAWP